MPLLDAMAREFGPRGFTLLGVNVEAADTSLDPFLKKIKLSFPILRDFDNKVAHAYNVQAMPTTLLIDRRGQWRWQHRAYLPGDEEQYLEIVRALLAEAP
jgi:peroxiredoxin